MSNYYCFFFGIDRHSASYALKTSLYYKTGSPVPETNLVTNRSQTGKDWYCCYCIQYSLKITSLISLTTKKHISMHHFHSFTKLKINKSSKHWHTFEINEVLNYNFFVQQKKHLSTSSLIQPSFTWKFPPNWLFPY